MSSIKDISITFYSDSVNNIYYNNSGENPTLIIKYSNNWVYLYLDVPFEVVKGMLNAESIGKYVAEHIKSKFQYKRIS